MTTPQLIRGSKKITLEKGSGVLDLTGDVI